MRKIFDFIKSKQFNREYLIKELFYQSELLDDNSVIYHPSSRKFWAALSQVFFFLSLFIKFIIFGVCGLIAKKWSIVWLISLLKYGNDNVVTSGIVAILAGQAVAAMGWYTAKEYITKKQSYELPTETDDSV